jgi:adenylylsulfate kinase-like enzyme
MKTISNGKVIWITGLSGAGKSTLAVYLAGEIRRYLNKPAILLDGDELRMVIGELNIDSNKDYGRDARVKLAMAYSRLCRMLSQQGFIIVISTISLFKEVHKWNRSNIPGYYEVYLDVSLDELISRDPKSIYKGYYAGLVKNVAGLDLKVDVPDKADYVINSNTKNDLNKLSKDLLYRVFGN